MKICLVVFSILLIQNPSEKQILRDRLNTADIVVVGGITEIQPAEIIDLLAITFNINFDARFQFATIEPEETFIPSDIEFKRLMIVFPMSEEGRWKDFPKFNVGDSGVFILRNVSFTTTKGTRMDIPMIIKPIDFQSKERFEELKKLYINYPPR